MVGSPDCIIQSCVVVNSMIRTMWCKTHFDELIALLPSPDLETIPSWDSTKETGTTIPTSPASEAEESIPNVIPSP